MVQPLEWQAKAAPPRTPGAVIPATKAFPCSISDSVYARRRYRCPDHSSGRIEAVFSQGGLVRSGYDAQ